VSPEQAAMGEVEALRVVVVTVVAHEESAAGRLQPDVAR